MSEMSAPGRAEASAINRIRLSWLSRGSRGLAEAIIELRMPNAECLMRMPNAEQYYFVISPFSIRHSAFGIRPAFGISYKPYR
jgi:hypothetical protein